MSKIIKLTQRKLRGGKRIGNPAFSPTTLLPRKHQQVISIPASYNFPLHTSKVIIEKVGDELRIRPWDSKVHN